ncbi:MAG: hypothetical protein AAF391_02920 [Bacteroidota bacterium]
MKIQANISQKTLQVLLGLFIGFVVLAQNTISVQSQQHDDAQEQSDEDESEEKQLVLSQAVPSSTLQVNLDFQSFLLEEVTLDEEGEEQKASVLEWLPSAQKALKILFRRIISPNAP